MVDTPPSQPGTAYLFDLPPELRNYIVELVVTQPRPILLRAKRKNAGFVFWPIPPALSQTCRQLKQRP